MHELSIAMSILDVAQEAAARHGSVRIEVVHIKLGRMAGVVKDALLSAFELAREGTVMDTCRLSIEEIPVIAFCPACAAEQPIPSIQEMRCPVCGTLTPDIRHGRELEVTAMEISQ